ncbi:T9SS type B sorting domain-containing protein [Yeosuana sp.]|uniref:T9SS type B sorting domain-containing protein n=1 Tax=Yeosuana sp. TaxID=2529388 RepID=UPI004049E698
MFNLGNRSCNAIASFNVAWFQQPTAIQPNDYVICEAEPYDNVEIFDLSTKTVAILGTQSSTDFAVSYHASLNDAETNNAPLPLLYTNSLPVETIFARVQNNFNTVCIDITSFNIQVIQQPAISAVSDDIICDAFNDGVETFNLATKTNEVLNGQSETIFEVTYFLTIDDATNGLNTILSPITNTTSQQTIFYTIAAIGNNACASIGSFQIGVSTTPISNALIDYYLCDIDNDLVEIFDLQSKNTEILGSQAASDFQITYHFSQNEANDATNPLAANYQNSCNPQTIYARIQSVTNVDCFETSFFEIGLDQFPIANSCDDLFLCDDSDNDGFEVFDLQANESQILGNQSSTDFSISFHENQIDSETGNNPLPSLFTNESNPQIIYVRIVNNDNQDCYDLTSFSLEVKPSPTIDLQESYTICEGVPITIFAPSGFTSYAWSTGANNNSTIINSAGLYSLTVTKDYGDIICTSTQEFEVVNSNIATILSIKTADWTANQNSITVYAEGDGDYEYSLDGITYQDSNQFFGLLSGEYTVFVNDKNECGNTIQDVFLLNYPKFFTPNGDGDNDFWRIKFSETEPALEVSIFDRYGKIITVFKGHQLGWDGTYNGQNLPSTDYWFVIKRQNGKIYKGHFAMKR